MKFQLAVLAAILLVEFSTNLQSANAHGSHHGTLTRSLKKKHMKGKKHRHYSSGNVLDLEDPVAERHGKKGKRKKKKGNAPNQNGGGENLNGGTSEAVSDVVKDENQDDNDVVDGSDTADTVGDEITEGNDGTVIDDSSKNNDHNQGVDYVQANEKEVDASLPADDAGDEITEDNDGTISDPDPSSFPESGAGDNDAVRSDLPEGCNACSTNADCADGGQCKFRANGLYCTLSDGTMSTGCFCDFDNQCSSGRCVESISLCIPTLGSCDVCNSHTDCSSLLCLERAGERQCALPNGKMGEGCKCDVGSNCVSGLCHGGICVALKHNGNACAEGAECQSSYCFDGFCSEPDVGLSCSSNNDCSTGRCKDVCVEKIGSCQPCDDPSDCTSGFCKLQNGQRVCAMENEKMTNGCYCNGDEDCDSGRCEESEDNTLLCQPKLEAGEPCEDNGDCLSGNCSAFLFFSGTCKGLFES